MPPYFVQYIHAINIYCLHPHLTCRPTAHDDDDNDDDGFSRACVVTDSDSAMGDALQSTCKCNIYIADMSMSAQLTPVIRPSVTRFPIITLSTREPQPHFFSEYKNLVTVTAVDCLLH